MQKVKLTAWYIQGSVTEDSTDEVYFLVGSKKSGGATSSQVIPATDFISIENGKRKDGNWVLYDGVLNDREVVVINVTVIDQDTSTLDIRREAAEKLIPTQAVDDLPVVVLKPSHPKVTWEDVNNGIDKATETVDKIGKLIEKVDEVIKKVGNIFDPHDDILGSFTVRVGNNSGVAYWEIEDGGNCTQFVPPNKEGFTVNLTGFGVDYLIGGRVTPANQ